MATNCEVLNEAESSPNSETISPGIVAIRSDVTPWINCIFWDSSIDNEANWLSDIAENEAVVNPSVCAAVSAINSCGVNITT